MAVASGPRRPAPSDLSTPSTGVVTSIDPTDLPWVADQPFG
ncbi:hypothetical protein Pd630_LPD02732 [Rhodococcus opacus PD630]|nr:hypothetical protein Pd630_LPD02732 [Rhodococcus opacus PD630]